MKIRLELETSIYCQPYEQKVSICSRLTLGATLEPIKEGVEYQEKSFEHTCYQHCTDIIVILSTKQ